MNYSTRNYIILSSCFKKLLRYDHQKIHSISCCLAPQNEQGISIDDPRIKNYLTNLRKEFHEKQYNTAHESDLKRMKNLSRIINPFEERNVVLKNLNSLKDLENEKDEDMKELIKEEREVYTQIANQLEASILEELLNLDQSDESSSVLFEVNAGVGGQEAMLFASELFNMYNNFIEYKQWSYEDLDADYTDIGGLRHGSVIVHSTEAFQYLKHEAGVHRVQRVPITEKSGRMHTSTVSVAVIPQTSIIDITLNEKDLRIETKRASGAGGQHVNTTESAVRITHIPTGESVEAQEDRSQIRNREIAMKRLKARLWQKAYETQEATKHATRKSQVGSSTRNEKIRTYNFTQDRITDHRLKDGTSKHLKEFLKGSQLLDQLIKRLRETEHQERIFKLISELENTST